MQTTVDRDECLASQVTLCRECVSMFENPDQISKLAENSLRMKEAVTAPPVGDAVEENVLC
ncbi:hypothetical protein [Parendozoicomonas sp. Alg238-R29]|uniref:hypothetical protein n=1 Tax=Parendozoicomonas sp. Alg238-R29 TaxID=2993446 RepID=UPI00248EB9C0|nr:hypothetical protein [Parendozoicomonas sp. Alg238-R29]